MLLHFFEDEETGPRQPRLQDYDSKATSMRPWAFWVQMVLTITDATYKETEQKRNTQMVTDEPWRKNCSILSENRKTERIIERE